MLWIFLKQHIDNRPLRLGRIPIQAFDLLIELLVMVIVKSLFQVLPGMNSHRFGLIWCPAYRFGRF
jgi:hypothetical protein